MTGTSRLSACFQERPSYASFLAYSVTLNGIRLIIYANIKYALIFSFQLPSVAYKLAEKDILIYSRIVLRICIRNKKEREKKMQIINV